MATASSPHAERTQPFRALARMTESSTTDDPHAPLGRRPREPGWYTDPSSAGGWRRYWDGERWTNATPDQLAQLARRRRRRGGVGALVLGLVLIAGVIVASLGGGGTSTHRHARVSPRVTPVPAVTTNAAASVVDAYVAAYNSRHIDRLQALFAPTLTRVIEGSSHVQGLSGTMAVLRSQLRGPGDLALVLRDEHVSLGPGDVATATASYGVNINGRRQRGTLTLHLVASGGALLIDRIALAPSGSTRAAPHPPPRASTRQSSPGR